MKSENIPSIIQAQALANLYQTQKIIIAEAGNGAAARQDYDQLHLQNALYLDLDSQLAEVPENAANGGRHPLPKIEKFGETLISLGISKDDHIIIYDRKNGANAAARFWWMLKSAGFEKVQVLNGGFQAALQANLPMDDHLVIPQKVNPYPVDSWKLPTVGIKEVEAFASDPKSIVIDVREPIRYDGKTEPIDLVAGHIPGAINIPFAENLNANGEFLSPEVLRSKYERALNGTDPENIAVHCGSGVTACHTLLAMDYAGLKIPNLYVGSWSEWSRNEKPIATNT
ncbi:sulfurtransferase [Flavobacterium noncentrifugens]|uniref:Thiosulfate/3-mercaptopyruvate sulfurtransferase n=1 Tax=Flavobacterium noncentrifugens TaxID=1128970 RepID=A0A1G8ZPZ4_9FLAO|nr:sulfurtransferase [Flavobacterium noncentrifugens]GEP51876.1 sulfurtransferase [Flavobacterium noncentrifugens]SDK17172.1 thiosulfate/3-mercaptopyruvate sulfurtransferase [Flavobacterium noncentrifugens]